MSVTNKGVLDLRAHMEHEKHTSSVSTRIWKLLLPLICLVFFMVDKWEVSSLPVMDIW
jgi:hypothetical protein